jgi:hypothetical protein
MASRNSKTAKQEAENLGFDSYELAEIVARFVSGKVLTKEFIFINVGARSGSGRAFYYLSDVKTDNSEGGYFFDGDFVSN